MRKQLLAFFVPLILTAAVTTMAQEYTNRRDVFQDESLRRDFMLQGEYLAKTDNFNMGVHLIADGGSKFRVVAYIGGLPGDGWKAGAPRLLGTAEANGEEISFDMTESRNADDQLKVPASGKAKIVIERPQGGQRQGGQGGAARRGGVFRGFPVKIEVPANDKIPAMVFEKQYRQSPSLGEKAQKAQSFFSMERTLINSCRVPK